ncbi:MAG: alpha/beta hydrolase [bacterium]|nr:alpha/beta hydrolase [bacterium]
MRRTAALCIAMSLASAPVAAVVVSFEVAVPPDTPGGAIVHLAGDFQGWRPGDADWALRPGEDGRWRFRTDFAEGRPLQFKFTLGGWDRVEKGPAGEELQNRLHVAAGDTTLRLVVARWADGGPPRATATGDIRPLAVPGFLGGRRVWVWLPPGYADEPDRRYPVFYVLDGQNAFDAATSFAGEWEIDESLARLVADGEVEPLIVVAVANGGALRTDEYTPWPGPDPGAPTGGHTAGGRAGEHLTAIVTELMPAVDDAFRTRRGPDHTGLCGSSFGGLMALHAGWARPDVFGRLAALSPSLGWAGGAPLAMIEARERPAVRLYTDMGTRERGHVTDGDGNGTDDAIDDLRTLREALLRRGFREGIDLLVVEDEGARHHESHWARRFPVAARFLFPGPAARR